MGDSQKHSSRTWVGGGVEIAPSGHLPLPEARRWAVGQLEEAELLLAVRDGTLAEAQGKMRAALAERDRAYGARQQARAAVKRWQEDLAWRMSTDAPEDPGA